VRRENVKWGEITSIAVTALYTTHSVFRISKAGTVCLKSLRGH
jgi:hypothetical protein